MIFVNIGIDLAGSLGAQIVTLRVTSRMSRFIHNTPTFIPLYSYNRALGIKSLTQYFGIGGLQMVVFVARAAPIFFKDFDIIAPETQNFLWPP